MDDAELDRHRRVLEDVAAHGPGEGWAAARALTAAAVAGRSIAPALAALGRVCADPARGALRAGAATALLAHLVRANDRPGLRALASSLGRDGTYSDALREAFDAAAKAGLDLAPALPLLLELHAEREARRNVLPDWVTDQLLAHAARTGDLEGVVRGLLANPRLEHLLFMHPARRRGCRLPPALPALAELLSGPRLRGEASLTLALLARDGVDLGGVVAALERRLDDEEACVATNVASALAHHHAARADWARLDALRARGGRSRAAVDDVLLALLREGRAGPEVVARLVPPGTPLRACRICSRLPRRSSAAPAELRPRDGALWCPECGRAYLSVTEEVDDGASQLGIPARHHELTRLTPPQTLARLDGPARAEFERGLDAWRARLRDELADPRVEVRVEAAIDLAACLVHARAWDDLLDLSRGAREPALRAALRPLLADPAPPSDVLAAVRAALGEPGEGPDRRA